MDSASQTVSSRGIDGELVTGDDRRVTEETVGARIRRLRISRGLSQREISGPGVSYAYISRIENGQRLPSVRALRFLAGKLGVDAEYLETGAAIPAAKERELRLADAELELRLGQDIDRAEQVLRTLLDENVPDGLAGRIRATLGIILARKGDNLGAIRELESVVASGAVRPETRPDVYETLSRAYLGTHAPVMAIQLLQGCIDEIDVDERRVPAQIRYRTFLATALSSMGALDRARAVLDEATERAEELGGFGQRVALHWERARLLWLEGDGDGALAAVSYARALAELSEDTLEVARAYLFSAQILNYEGKSEEAAPHLEKAERILLFGDDALDRGILRAEQAKREAALGHGKEALSLANEAVGLLEDHSRYASTAWHARAAAYVALGDIDAADAEYRRAVEALFEREQWREAMRISQKWAGSLRAAGQDERAFGVLERATSFGRAATGAAS
jgi:transcriptional regulator with XRE-family HTH domain